MAWARDFRRPDRTLAESVTWARLMDIMWEDKVRGSLTPGVGGSQQLEVLGTRNAVRPQRKNSILFSPWAMCFPLWRWPQ